MTLRRSIFCILGVLEMCAVFPAVADERKAVGNTLQIPAGQMAATIRETAMPDLGEGNLARILKRYYTEGLGGAKKWDQVSSLKIAGTLKLDSGDYEFKAYQKKPDFIKMSMSGHERDIVLGYDGKTAWHKLHGRDVQAKPMPEFEARRFKYSACFGSHLLYPFAEGKKIEYIDTVPTAGNICHHVRVTLDDSYQVDYFIDIRTYLQIKVVNTDLRNGIVNSIFYRDYTREFAIPIARQMESHEGGEWVSLLKVDEIKLNSGVIPWMFKMPR